MMTPEGLTRALYELGMQRHRLLQVWKSMPADDPQRDALSTRITRLSILEEMIRLKLSSRGVNRV